VPRALDELDAAHAELAIEEATVGWLRQWPDGKGVMGQRYVHNLPATPNGYPITAEAVLDALRKRGLPIRREGGVVAPSTPMIETL
jgi:hypothetical protein